MALQRQVSGRLENIAFIKTIMMVLVVLYHSMLFFGGTWFTIVEPVNGGGYLYYIAKWIGTFHIQTFAMASGFLFYYLRKEKSRYNNPAKDIKKRAKRLLIPYLFTSLLWVIPIGYLFYKNSLSDIFNKYVLMTGPSQLWFLIMLFVVFVFFVLIGKKIKLSFRNLAIIYVVTTGLGLLLSKFSINYFQIATSVRYILYFYLGGYIYENRQKISLKQVGLMVLGTIVLYVFVLLFRNANNMVLSVGVKYAETLVSVLEVSSIYYLFSKLIGKQKSLAKSRFYHVFEQNSFGIYLFHQQIIYFVIIWLNGLVYPIVQMILSFIIALFTSLIMSLILRRWKVTRFMFGLE